MPDPTPAPAPSAADKLVSFVLDTLLAKFSGLKTYLAAAGLAGLALYQLSQGDIPAAVQSAMAALATVGLRHAIAKA